MSYSRKGLAEWILGTSKGKKFLSWFGRRYWKEILATELGYSFHQWMRDKVIEETSEQQQERRKKVVVEVFPDGFIRVFGEGLDVVFVHRLRVHSVAAEVIEEELAYASCPDRAKEVYGKAPTAISFFTSRTIQDEVERRSMLKIFRAVGPSRKPVTRT
jgi:hypothetical protein